MITITPSRRRGLLLLLVGFLVFLGCFAFPLVNLTLPEYNRFLLSPSLVDTLLFPLGLAVGYTWVGVLARMLLGPRCLGKMLGLVLAATAVGFLCRYGLEYGETSIAYAFSLPNCAFHLAAAAGLTLLGACLAHLLRRR